MKLLLVRPNTYEVWMRFKDTSQIGSLFKLGNRNRTPSLGLRSLSSYVKDYCDVEVLDGEFCNDFQYYSYKQ